MLIEIHIAFSFLYFLGCPVVTKGICVPVTQKVKNLCGEQPHFSKISIRPFTEDQMDLNSVLCHSSIPNL
jgi:hypothetical protein